jgi:hypothetical protein
MDYLDGRRKTTRRTSQQVVTPSRLWVNAFQSRGNVDPVAHQIAITLFDHITKMNANAELDAALWRHSGITLDHRVLYLDAATNRVYYTAEFNNCSVTGTLHYATVVHGNRRIDQVAAQGSQSRQRAVFIGSSEPTETDHIGGQDGHQTALQGVLNHLLANPSWPKAPTRSHPSHIVALAPATATVHLPDTPLANFKVPKTFPAAISGLGHQHNSGQLRKLSAFPRRLFLGDMAGSFRIAFIRNSGFRTEGMAREERSQRGKGFPVLAVSGQHAVIQQPA